MLGDTITLRLASGRLRQLKVVGIVQDLTIGAGGLGGGFFLAPSQGYITDGTLSWLEFPEIYNTLYVTLKEGKDDPVQIHQVASKVLDEFERLGYVTTSSIERKSTDHPNVPYLDSLLGVLALLGLLVVFLSAFLITNTLSALLNQQIQQVGVMKTIGASRFQIVVIYMVLIFTYSLAALGLALLAADPAAYLQLKFLAGRINFIVPEVRPVPRSLILMIGIAMIVPQIAGAAPILQGARITIQQALSGVGTAIGDKPSPIYRWLMKFRRISRPMMISLRNTFRRRVRLVLTLVTLILGGAIFIATFNVSKSIDAYITRLGRYYLADVNLTLSKVYSISEVSQLLSVVPGVGSVEGWAAARAELIGSSGAVGESVIIQAPPSDSKLIEPIMQSGRWIVPGDKNAIVLSEMFLSTMPDLKVGDTLKLKVNGEDSEWVVVGFFQFAGKSGGLLAYTDNDYLSNLTGTAGKTNMFRIVGSGSDHSLGWQKDLGRRIEAHLESLGYDVTDIRTGLDLRFSSSKGLDTLTIFLLILALLMAAVGSIGLMGTMSLNVMERTREIGVMRAIGATDRQITRMVMVEGLIIGMISWLLASAASFPISKALSDVVSIAIFSTPIAFTFNPAGILIWFALVMLLSILASISPARVAARMTIREVLAYE